MRKLLISIPYLASMFLAGCSLDPVKNLMPSVYKIDVKQGNHITKEMIDQLKPGMNKRQVRFLLGTPLLIDVFHQERWDYIYSEQPGGGARMQKRISLYFKEEKLAALQGDFRPDEADRSALMKETTTVEVPAKEKEKSLYQKTLGIVGLGEEDENGEATESSDSTSENSQEESN